MFWTGLGWAGMGLCWPRPRVAWARAGLAIGRTVLASIIGRHRCVYISSVIGMVTSVCMTSDLDRGVKRPAIYASIYPVL